MQAFLSIFIYQIPLPVTPMQLRQVHLRAPQARAGRYSFQYFREWQTVLHSINQRACPLLDARQLSHAAASLTGEYIR
ncbi:MAG: hypothetical protein MUO77_01790 [Anaerolineales bacterium]|nr:hypothetical protein [Anaerolineales bacterium]